MRKNVNKNERIIRGVAGAALTSLAFLGPANPLFLIGLVPLATGLVGTCPLYSSFHVSSVKDSAKESEQHYLHPA